MDGTFIALYNENYNQSSSLFELPVATIALFLSYQPSVICLLFIMNGNSLIVVIS